jgi:mono/diheme cytochrome c family protein
MRRILCATLTASLSLSACRLRDRDLPAVYRVLEVPVERLASPDVRHQGRALFHEHCIICHGDLANGQGVTATYLTPPPRDLTSAEWQGQIDDRHLYYVIAEGRRGTAMPRWKPSFSPGEIWSVVAYIRSLGPPVPAGEESAPSGSAPSAGSGPRR